MSWNLLAYAIPLFGGLKTIAALQPATYRKYDDAPESAHSAVVKEVAERALNAENQPGATYQERIRDMIEELPDSVGVKNVKALVATRLKVASIRNEATPIHSTGTDLDIGTARGKFFIGIHPDTERTSVEALPWICTHEICHLLEGDWVEITGVKAVVSLSATVLSTFVFGWALLPSVGTACLANIVTHVAMSRRAENRADDFANKHCTEEERRNAIAFLEQTKNTRPQGISTYLGKIVRAALHPSEEVRIAKIRSTFASADKRKTA